MASKFLLALGIFVTAITLRVDPSAGFPPYDDLYHAKRIRYSAQHFPRVLNFDRQRGLTGAFCPWPPLYDLASAAGARLFGARSEGDIDACVRWFPPILFSLFAAAVGLAVGPVAGMGIAISPYLIGVSRTAAIDHHWVEPALLLWIVYAVARRRPVLLGVALTAAMFAQTAFLVAAALALVVALPRDEGSRTVSFIIPAVAIVVYRVLQPAGYPDSAWFLGWAYVACFAAAAIASLRTRISILLAALVIAPFVSTILQGLSFFRGDAWLRTIIEFQPMFRDPSRIGTDIANLTGGAILVFMIARRHRVIGLFGIVYLLLALSSRRFLVPAIPLLVIAGSIAVSEAKSKRAALVAMAMTLLPPLLYDISVRPERRDDTVEAIAQAIRPLPPGRVLAPWPMGHAIDVIGGHAVVVDNFGPMPDAALFARANAALRDRDIAWCRAHGIRYMVIGREIIHLP